MRVALPIWREEEAAPTAGGGRAPIARTALGALPEGTLTFAQVREDPLLEIEALAPAPGSRHVVVSSGGCTALSLLATGAVEVVAVDLNPAQNHLVELKAAACTLGGSDAVAFLGGAPMDPWARQATFLRLRDLLTPPARAYWRRRERAVRRGVLGAGVTERFLRLLVWLDRVLVHPAGAHRALLACRSLAEQRDLYRRVWNNRRWRALFRLLASRRALTHVFDEGFFRHVARRSFGEHFRLLFEHGLCEVPAAANYFLHFMLAGRYPEGPEGLPPYLSRAGARSVAEGRGRLSLVDGSLLDYLRAQPAGSLDGFSLSNVAEWLDPAAQDALWSEIVRTARPGARLGLRNFVGWTTIPAARRAEIVLDEARGAALIRTDRSLMQHRFVPAVLPGRPVGLQGAHT